MMRILLIIAIAIGYTAYQLGYIGDHSGVTNEQITNAVNQYLPKNNQNDDTQTIRQAFESQTSNLQVEASGRVEKILKDDTKQPRHQRFILRLDNDISLLVAHNIDLAKRIEDLKIGDTVRFYGEYEWNNKGGVLHWTHHDPKGRHPAGWLRHNGNIYQ